MFVARGLCYLIGTESIPVDEPLFQELAYARIPLGGRVAILQRRDRRHSPPWSRSGWRTPRASVARCTPSAAAPSPPPLMGSARGHARSSRVYALSGFCAALAGLVMTVYMLSGYSLHAVGLELDAIAAVVIGGTLLTGGVGYVAGTVVGVLILGIIQTLVIFNGTLSSWWTRIVVGILLFVFCVSQKLIESRASAPTGEVEVMRSFGLLEDGRSVEAITLGSGSRLAGRSAHVRRHPAPAHLPGARRTPRPHPVLRPPGALRARPLVRGSDRRTLRQPHRRGSLRRSTGRPTR